MTVEKNNLHKNCSQDSRKFVEGVIVSAYKSYLIYTILAFPDGNLLLQRQKQKPKKPPHKLLKSCTGTIATQIKTVKNEEPFFWGR